MHTPAWWREERRDVRAQIQDGTIVASVKRAALVLTECDGEETRRVQEGGSRERSGACFREMLCQARKCLQVHLHTE